MHRNSPRPHKWPVWEAGFFARNFRWVVIIVDTQTLAERLARAEEAISNLEGWQSTQNGSLQRMADRVDKLADKVERMYVLALTAALSAIASLVVLIARG